VEHQSHNCGTPTTKGLYDLIIQKKITMALHYDLYENPLPPGSNRRKRLHARVVTTGTTPTDWVAKVIHDRSTLTEGDVKATLSCLTDVLVSELSQGKRVHLEGLGYFQLTLSAPAVRTPKDIRAGSVRVKSVVFRPEVELKDRFSTVRIKRVPRKNHSAVCDAQKIDRLLERYFGEHAYITARQFQELCGLTRTTACRRLKQLVEEGKLKKTGYTRAPLYVRV